MKCSEKEPMAVRSDAHGKEGCLQNDKVFQIGRGAPAIV